jgi:hypothetical protein
MTTLELIQAALDEHALAIELELTEDLPADTAQQEARKRYSDLTRYRLDWDRFAETIQQRRKPGPKPRPLPF